MAKEEEDVLVESANVSTIGDSSTATDWIERMAEKPLSFELTADILGTGSHGTVVFKGVFQGRPVAIKRMITEFYQIADNQVQLLQEADQHPNICSYFYREYHNGFIYMVLELCDCNLQDLIMSPIDPHIAEIRNQIPLKSVMEQVILGVQHLHSLNIVHRDLKPVNILLLAAKSPLLPAKVLITDFSLGKRLTDGQSSFSTANDAGTAGWRAPETFGFNPYAATYEPRLTKAIDIFSAGCVLYYIISQGEHPFGVAQKRDVNILKGNFRFRHLDSLAEDGVLLKHLLKFMVVRDYKKRVNADYVLHHPFFWKNTKKIQFLIDVSDRLELERETSAGADSLSKLIEAGQAKVTTNWISVLPPNLYEELSKYRSYDAESVQDLLRAFRNKVF
jgi:serine/threonine-protein kinase/endoribonuclease IRE1